MPRHTVLFVSIALVATLAACHRATEDSAGANASARAGGGAAPAVAAAPQAPSVRPDPDPAASFTLTMDGVDRYIAAMHNLLPLARKNPALADAMAINASEEDEAQYAARIRKHPDVVAAMSSAGLTPEAFALTGEALMAGMMGQGAIDSGALKKIPDGVNPQYVDFARQNKAALARKMQELQAMH